MAGRTEGMEHFWDSLPGWFGREDAAFYRSIVAQAPSRAAFVEVGCWLGRSTACLAVEIANSGKEISLHAVDTWRGTPHEPEHEEIVREHGGDVFAAFRENLRIGGVCDLVCPVISDPVEAAGRFGDASVDFVFLGADHSLDAVRRDIKAWLPKVRRGGVLGGHDADRPAVRAGIQDALPFSRVAFPSRHIWKYRKEQPPGRWVRPVPEGEPATLPPHLLFVPVLNRPDLLRRAVESVMSPGVSLFVLDNTPDGLDADVLRTDVGLFRPDQPLNFTQSMNFACFEAEQRGAQWLVFMHNDACGDVRLVSDLLGLGERRAAASPVGVLFTAYDAVAAFNMDAVRDVGAWDESWRWYSSDIDYYHRMRLCGWVTYDSPFGDRVVHEISATAAAGAGAASLKDAFAYEMNHYVHKWGGAPGQERSAIPYDGAP